MDCDDTVVFRHKDLPCISFAAFKEMRKNSDLCDLTIRVQGHSFSAHRVILAAGIPFFHMAFTNSGVRIEDIETAVSKLDPTALGSLINFAYTGAVAISPQNVDSLLLTSEFLRLLPVRDACVEFLSKRIDASNVTHVRAVAESLGIPSLMERASRYIRKNFEEFSKSTSFSTIHHTWIKEIISKDDLNVSNEEIVLKAILDWVKVSPDERRSFLPKLLREVRLVFLPTEYLMTLIASEEIIRTSIHSRDVIDAVKNYHLSGDKSTFGDLKTSRRIFSSLKYDLYAVCRNTPSEISVSHCDFPKEKWLSISESKVPEADNLYHVIAVNEEIYLFFENVIYTFHVKVRKWKVQDSAHNKIEGSTIASRGCNIYVFGSANTDFRNKVRCFNTQQSKWLKEVRMKIGREFAAAASLQENIYVTGGYTASRNRLSTVEKYTPSTGHWEECASMMTPRTSHSCTSLNGKIYVCGGFNLNSRSRSLEVYDPIVNRWISLSCMKFERCNFSLVPYNDTLFVIGGKMGAYSVASGAEIYDGECDHWKTGFPAPDKFQGAVSIATVRK